MSRLRSTPTIVQIEQAEEPLDPFSPLPVRNSLLGGVLGLLLCGALVFLIEYLDDTIKTPEDVNRLLDLTVIGLVGEMENAKSGQNSVYVGENPRSPIAEAYRVLRTNLEFASVDQPLQTLLITSVAPEEGKSTTAVNLAAIIAQGGKKVVLLDADLRRPSVHRLLQISNRAGLSDLFLADAGDLLQVCSWGDTKLWALPSGPLPPNPTELLGSEKLAHILARFKEQADIVIIDSPPSIVSDPIILSSKVDGVLLVIKPGSTRIGAAQAMLEQFRRAGARVVGVVLNPISRNRANYYGKYQYYSKYYAASEYGHYYSSDVPGRRKRSGAKRPRMQKNGSDADPSAE